MLRAGEVLHRLQRPPLARRVGHTTAEALKRHGYRFSCLLVYSFAALSIVAAKPALACDIHSSFTIKPDSTGGASLWNCKNGQTIAYQSANHAIQAAIDSLQVGGTILVRAGTYNLTGGIEVKDDITISGETDSTGAPATFLNVVSGAAGGNTIRNFRPGVAQDDPTFLAGRRGIAIKNLTIDAGTHVEYVVSFNRCIDTVVKNVRISNPRGSAFGSSGCVNLLFEECVAQAPTPASYGGHGFSIGGAPNGVRDAGTTLLNSSAYGFNWRSGGNSSEGVLLRALAGTNCSPNCQGNLDFRVIGGNFANNAVGIRILDANNPLIQNVRVYNNLEIGLEVRNTSLPKEATKVSVVGGSFEWNGYAASDMAPSSKMGGVSIAGADSTVAGVYMVENRPNNLVLDGKYFYIAACRFKGDGTRTHIFLIPYHGAPLTGWVIRSCYSGAGARWGGLPVSPDFTSITQWMLDWSPDSADPPAVCQMP